MRKKTALLFLILFSLLILVSCKKTQVINDVKSKTFYTYFDTVISVMSYADETDKQFEENCNFIESLLDKYNRLFDIYHEYSGINNLCTVNNNAGESIVVDPEIIQLLKTSIDYYHLTNGEMNIMMGSVFNLWHEVITDEAELPSDEQLFSAFEHCNIDCLSIDEDNNTVRIEDAYSRLDVGAVAKGFATEKIAQALIEKGVSSYIINAGGNVRLIGTKPDGTGWKVAIRNPDVNAQDFAEIFTLSNTSCVTSGVYERSIEIDGKQYHHIIDKDTLKPSLFFDSVSVVTGNSAYADALSTALFCMSYGDGVSLAKKLGDIKVLWIKHDGTKLIYEE